ncbi:hypothetical protein NPIL_224881 [Nephila pilipes]|uniref:Uncharacterized protein n=1 Tax=Nephila pilipes TaxID=299642 RepID=A0A8X6PR74_NEPPI|nr:hypothetical protein NPIL_224881 [Nephila pilipes]
MSKVFCNRIWNNLTRQVVSRSYTSLLTELKVSTVAEKGSSSTPGAGSKFLSELGGVGERSREHSVFSERNEAFGGNGGKG